MNCQSEMMYNISGQMEEKLGTYFNYFKEELTTIKEATANLDIKARKYAKKDNKLYTRKDRLFNEGNPKSWEIKQEDLKKIDPKDIVKDKGVAMKLMLPKVLYAYY